MARAGLLAFGLGRMASFERTRVRVGSSETSRFTRSIK